MHILFKILFSKPLHGPLSILLGGVFLYAGILKILDPLKLADAIYAFRLLPREAIAPLALLFPALEILSGIFLITGWKRRIGALAILCLSLLFSAVILSAIARGLVINCSCFGEVGLPSALKLRNALFRDFLLVVLSLWIYYRELKLLFSTTLCTNQKNEQRT